MRHPRSASLFWLATIVFGFAIWQADALTRGAEARFTRPSAPSGAREAALVSEPLCPEELRALSISVYNAEDLAGQQVHYTVAGTPAGVAVMAWPEHISTHILATQRSQKSV